MKPSERSDQWRTVPQTLEAYVQRIVQKEFHPPRTVSLLSTIRTSIASDVVLMVFGLTGFGASLLELYASHKYLLGIAGIIVGSLLFVLPVLAALPVFRVLRHGVVAEADIYDMHNVPPGHSGRTFRSYRNGYIEGRWRVWDGAIDEPYVVDAAWAQDATLGSKVAVLLHPNGKRIVLPIGLAHRR